MATLSANPGLPTPARGARQRVALRLTSGIMMVSCILCAMVILFVLALVTAYLVSLGGRYISLDFFTQMPIPPGAEGAPGGMKNGLIGTLILITMASLVGVPLGILTGVCLSEYGANSRLAGPTRFIADVLTGVPSIVVGILGYELLVVPLGSFNGYAGAAALAFIMIPLVARTTEEMLLLVPHSYREASVALGASQARTIFTVVLPSAAGSVITGVMLAIARIAGETAPLLFTALGSRLLSVDPSRPFPSLTLQIFQYASGPYRDQQQLAWAGVLILIGLIFILNVTITMTVRRLQASQLRH